MSSPVAQEDKVRVRRRRTSTQDERLLHRRAVSRGDSREGSRDPSRGREFSRRGVVDHSTSGGMREITIRSKYLLDAIKKVNQHPPLQPAKDFFAEQEPYPTLFHHIDDVKREIAQLGNEDADDHLKILLNAVGHVNPIWNEAREENFSNGLVSHNMIWKLFRPGDLVLREDDIGNLWLFVLIEISYYIDTFRKRYTQDLEEERRATFTAWSLTWDDADGYLTRRNTTFTCTEFSGQRPIKSLPVYPIRFQEHIKGVNTGAFLGSRGRKWWKLIGEPSICQQHSGLAYVQEHRQAKDEKFRADGRVVIDDKWKTPTGINSILRLDDNTRERVRDVGDLREAYQWDRLPKSTVLTNTQAMLCPPVIGCHDLRSRKRYTVSIDNLQPVKWNEDAMDHLVLDNKKKDMLKGLVRYHSNRNRRNERGDIIAGKGQSLVILLHGPPGVGKTLTAESTAEAVRKPLVSMSIGEMVWDETQLQERLKSEFQRAIDWDAILLLDEADVVLEARSFEDSRIQIGISFQSMTPKIRAEVWTQLLTLNGRDKILGPEALRSIQTKLSKYELNGRQIRNVLNVAEGLAFQEYGEEGKLEYRHIEEATKAAAEFQKMLEESKSMMKLEQTVWAPYKGGDDDSIF
ncbi:hypothetical protein LI328DRAFT_156945 [Trichoderma asperelloides]|nr:hypothetical protein LI328DRAFT_156945 [Trichoderma asperelloides]